MGKVWVLDTETKGTGAEMVPLEKVLSTPPPKTPRRRRRRSEPVPPGSPAQPRSPLKFKVVDVMTRKVLAAGGDTRATIDLLEGVRSMVDVSIHVWDDSAGRWQELTLPERRALWKLRGR